jgi:hypothetical protein
MKLSNDLKIFIVLVLCIIGYIVYDKVIKTQPEQLENIENNDDNIIELKYFGGHYCPHSNKDSHSYKLIMEHFTKKYPDVKVNVYWSGEDNQAEFLKANAEYVPTITNNKYEHLELKLPEGFETDDKSDDELVDAVVDNLYNQLSPKF